ncbi:hypothetical protein [Streptomyces nigra]|uniref:Uncharacterized protein n=1 Tax=Streptomyces nigra TaxID=1827580 RepID=A0ABZ1J0X6_9ACTN
MSVGFPIGPSVVNGMAIKEVHRDASRGARRGIRAEVGRDGFSRYVMHAMERRREQDRPGEFADLLETGCGHVTKEEPAQAEAERLEIERKHVEHTRARRAAAENAPERPREAA